MSLTNHLKTPNSPVGQFLSNRFGNTRRLISEANTSLRGIAPLLPSVLPPNYSYGTVGMAIDYRIRYAIATTPIAKMAAKAGIASYAGAYTAASMGSGDFSGLTLPEGIAWEYLNRIDGEIARLQPVGRRLDIESDRLLARHCYVLALFEEEYRSGRQFGPLHELPEKNSIEDLLACVPDACVDDIIQLANLFLRQQSGLLNGICTLNPAFAGSNDVGGADADLIVDGCLIELKTTKQRTLDPQWLRQLLGYVLLDYEDAYGMQSIGVYMVRQGILLQWPLDDLVRDLTSNPNASVATLRSEFEPIARLSSKIRRQPGLR